MRRNPIDMSTALLIAVGGYVAYRMFRGYPYARPEVPEAEFALDAAKDRAAEEPGVVINHVAGPRVVVERVPASERRARAARVRYVPAGS